MDISCAFATSSDTPSQVELAETLGYKRAWLYDSPALYPDVWMILNRCAERTSRIGLGPGVLVPSLRHPMVNAAAIAELTSQAPGRVAVAIGSGFTGRMALG
jgi:5,10-methylenetetrahydromethanopterin reductase